MTPRQHGMLIALGAGMDSVLKWWAVMNQLNHGFLVRCPRGPASASAVCRGHGQRDGAREAPLGFADQPDPTRQTPVES